MINLLEYDNIIPAIILNNDNDLSNIQRINTDIKKSNKIVPIVYQELDNIEVLIKQFSNTQYIFFKNKISPDVITSIQQSNEVIILDDPFNPAERNADYPESEFYSNIHNDYKKERYIGFSDYQIIGKRISKGGPAYAVTIHWTCLKKNGQMWIYHFISDETDSTANVQGKYFQALDKLIKFFDSFNNHIETLAAKNYRDNNADQEYHGLGYPKRISIKNHIELLANF